MRGCHEVPSPKFIPHAFSAKPPHQSSVVPKLLDLLLTPFSSLFVNLAHRILQSVGHEIRLFPRIPTLPKGTWITYTYNILPYGFGELKKVYTSRFSWERSKNIPSWVRYEISLFEFFLAFCFCLIKSQKSSIWPVSSGWRNVFDRSLSISQRHFLTTGVARYCCAFWGAFSSDQLLKYSRTQCRLNAFIQGGRL